jgi:hypothetical protein
MPRTSVDPTNPLEAEEQATLVKWLEIKRWKFTSLAQSTFAGHKQGKRWVRHHGTNGKNAATGVRPGFPDLCVLVPCGNYKFVAVFVEMKRRKGVWSDVADEQRAWIASLNASGCLAAPCFGAADAIDFLSAIWANHAAVWSSPKAPFAMELEHGYVRVVDRSRLNGRASG